MLSRYLAGLATGLGVAGSLTAQQPAATFGRPTPQTVTARGQIAAPGVTARTSTLTAPAVAARTSPAAAISRSDTPRPAPAAAMPAPVAAPAAPSYAPTAQMLQGDCNSPAGYCNTECAAYDCLCGPPGKCWISAEYLYWTAKGMSVPPLITTSPAGTPQAASGVLGQPGTGLLFPSSGKTNDDWRSGFRLRAGTWLDQCQRFGIEGDFFFLGKSNDQFTAGGPPALVSRPFVNVLTGLNDSELVSYPGVLAGTVDARTSSDFIGGGFNFIQNLCCDPCGRLDALYGFRYLNLRDEVVINENLTALPGSNVPAGTRFLIQDRFRTSNNFYGGNVGLNYERRFGHCFLGVRGSVALGVTHSVTEISGQTTIISPTGVAQTYPGGLLTQGSNIGRYSSNSFAVVPEVGVRLGCQVTERLRAYVGYNFLYWSNVNRAGDQIDLGVNTNQIAPASGLAIPARPAYQPQKTDYWVQGISFGVEFRW